MSGYRKIPTSYEVWKAVKQAHNEELRVFSSYSAPDGDYYGNPERCRMFTEYGFDGCEYPIMGAESSWDKNHEEPHVRLNEEHEYWICCAKEMVDH